MKQALLAFSILFSSYQAMAKSALSVSHRPQGQESGYVGSIIFNYEMKDCFNDLHVAIALQRSMASQEYIYKGKSYSPQDLGLQSFVNAKVGLVSELSADVMDRSQRVGRISMSTVIDQAGAGCYGQSYSVKKSVPSFDGKGASKRVGDFVLTSGAVKASTRDYDLEAKIESYLQAEKMAKTKSVQDQALVAKANETASSLKSSEVGGTPNGTGETKSAPPVESTGPRPAQPQVDVQKLNQETQQNIEAADRAGRQFGEKAGEAAGHLGTAATGMWEAGHGMGFGLMGQDEDYSFFLNVALGQWDAWEGGAPSSFMAGFYTYLAIDVMAHRPVEGVPLSRGHDKFTRAIMGFDFLNNSWASDGWRVVYGPTLNFVDTFLPNGEKDKQLEMEFGFDLGLAFVNSGGLVALTYNLQSEVYGLQLIFKKVD